MLPFAELQSLFLLISFIFKPYPNKIIINYVKVIYTMTSNKDSIHNRLANEIALEQYNYQLLRDKVNSQLKDRAIERKQEIQKQLGIADRQLSQRIRNADDKVLKQLEDKKNLAESQRKIKASGQIRQQSIKFETQKVNYYKLVQQDNRLAQIINDLKSNSSLENAKQEAALKQLYLKREKLLISIQQSKLRQQTLMGTIDQLQSQL